MQTEKVEQMNVMLPVTDWNMWPRCEAKRLDTANLRKLEEALLSGCKLPPIIVDKKSNRIVDGWHRRASVEKVQGKESDIDVIRRHYDSDLLMFMDAIKLNNVHGLPLSPRDQVHCIIMLREKFGRKVPWCDIGPVIGMMDDRAKNFYEQRSATNPDGDTVPLSFGASMLAGKDLTDKEEAGRVSSSGILPIVYVRMLLRAIDAGMFPMGEKEEELCLVLITKLQAALNGKAKKGKGKKVN